MDITPDYAILGAAGLSSIIVVGTYASHLRNVWKARHNALVIPDPQTPTLETLLDETFTGELDWPHYRRNH